MKMSDEFRDLRDRLFRNAALRGAFDPREVLAEVLPGGAADNVLLRGHLMSALREACVDLARTGKAGGLPEGEGWLMRPVPRRKALAGFTPGADAPQGEILEALSGEGDFADTALEAIVMDPPDIETLEHTVRTLERAGPTAPGHGKLMALGATLNRLRKRALTDEILGPGFVGRDAEIAKVKAVLDDPQTDAPLATLHIEGMPGIGKTYLLEEIVRMCRERDDIVTVRLDFDRSSLRTGATEAIFDETSRQIGDALPEHAAELRRMRYDFATRQTEIGAAGSEMRVPYEMLSAMVAMLESGGHRLLFQLDTMEVLQGHGATFVDRLMEDLDRFAEAGRVGVSVISAGRGPIFRDGHKRLRDLIGLRALDAEITQAILRKKGLPEDLWPRIIQLSNGNPLRVILVARAVQEAEGLGDDEIRDVDNAFLYRAILSRVPADIREIAAEGLILPRLDVEALVRIVGPALGVDIDAERARDLLEVLRGQDWLVHGSVADGLSHRETAREEILELTYRERAESCAAINARAADHYAESDPARALYHRLQLTRDGREMPPIDPAVAQRMAEDLIEELPEPALDAVLQARGERSRGARSTVDTEEDTAPAHTSTARRKRRRKTAYWIAANPESAVGELLLVEPAPGTDAPSDRDIEDLRVLLESGDRREASALLRSRFTRPFAAEGEAGLLAFAHQWRSGQWSMAGILLELLSEHTLRAALALDSHLTGRMLLEAWAEFRTDALAERLAEDEVFLATAQEAHAATGRVGLQGGALDFVLMAVAGPEALSVPDALGVAAPFMPNAPQSTTVDMQNRAEAQRNEFGLFFALGQSGSKGLAQADAALAIAPVNPYAEPIRALISELEASGKAKVLQDLADLRPVIGELAEHLAPEVGGIGEALEKVNDRPTDILEVLIALGLLSEWARGYTFYHPIPELPTLAVAAERWQQTAAGLWRYGDRQPADWIPERAFDAQAETRAWRLLNGPEPERTALRALRIWAGPEDEPTAPAPAMLGKRLAGPYGEIAGATSLHERLERLQDIGVASVLQGPVAALSELGVPAAEVFGRG
ncbi:AAA ATPase-like protein [Aliiruegeria haliotis]|uniref:AAA ATPase-like protein n=1 Tax=Aliiruegeria haliotis TaxID=1280846 RepID=A0A2T0RY65_9RHOB|nr:ATP-binding protein [Aliiruegeria haliotis]PRY26125.1 AAA ATPase-like protein [Aliiruegeria haliotis]